METVQLYPALAFTAGLAITLFLAAYLTPRSWWRRPNARALLIMVVGAWGLGSLILYAAHGAHAAAAVPARAAAAEPPVIAAEAAPIAGKPFQVHRDLNLRVTAGVDSPRLVTVPAGATVTPTGMRSGDWWQIKASVAGRDNTGWVSSLWLRRSGE
ncbi:SH3 domain-containing protein [Duganella sp. CT11-25]|uniref:SH3 domain-containing protein n=1 Tax=unclassified Duganella TaxID=2636909 RepID=UPI0039AF3C38